MNVDFVVPIGRRERAWDKDCPFQAIQVKQTSRYGRPPFPLTPQFRKAFSAAVLKLKEKSLADETMLLPSDLILREIADQLGGVGQAKAASVT